MISLYIKKNEIIIIINKPEKVRIWNSYEKKPSTSLLPIGKCSIFNKRERYCFQNKLVKVGCLSEKRQRNQRSNCQHLLYHRKGKRIPEKHLFLLYWLCQSLWLCGSQKIWKIIKQMRIPDHLTCLLRNLYASQEATVRTGHETTDWFQIENWVHQGCIFHPAYLT